MFNAKKPQSAKQLLSIESQAFHGICDDFDSNAATSIGSRKASPSSNYSSDTREIQ